MQKHKAPVWTVEQRISNQWMMVVQKHRYQDAVNVRDDLLAEMGYDEEAPENWIEDLFRIVRNDPDGNRFMVFDDGMTFQLDI